MRRRRVLLIYDRIEIAERDWLICGLLWVAVGTLALGPFGFAARVGRGLFAFMLIVHTIEAFYTAIRAWRQGLDAQSWFLRTVVLGALALLALEVHLRKAPYPRLVQ
jgi:uncharacterized membrane protein HdeD (DUF308 family)